MALRGVKRTLYVDCSPSGLTGLTPLIFLKGFKIFVEDISIGFGDPFRTNNDLTDLFSRIWRGKVMRITLCFFFTPVVVLNFTFPRGSKPNLSAFPISILSTFSRLSRTTTSYSETG